MEKGSTQCSEAYRFVRWLRSEYLVGHSCQMSRSDGCTMFARKLTIRVQSVRTCVLITNKPGYCMWFSKCQISRHWIENLNAVTDTEFQTAYALSWPFTRCSVRVGGILNLLCPRPWISAKHCVTVDLFSLRYSEHLYWEDHETAFLL